MTDTCATCSFYVAGQCRVGAPLASTGNRKNCPTVAATDWCAQWNCWPGNPPYTGNAHATIGMTLPDNAAGNDGDFYVYNTKITIGGDVYVNKADLYQKQVGVWVIIGGIV